MKKKIIISLTIIAIFLIIICTVIFTKAHVLTKTNENTTTASVPKILTGEKISSVGEGYVEITTNENISDKASNSNLANKVLTQYNINSLSNESISTDNLTVKQYNNVLEGRKETVMSNDYFRITLNTDTDELISYLNQKNKFPKNTLKKDKIQEAATEIFEKLNISNSQQYEFTDIEQFDDEIWRAGFVKKEGDLIDQNNSVKFSFSPQTKEILTLAINHVKYANNSILISKDTADNIAKQYFSKTNATEIASSDIEIVRPNYYYEDNRDSGIYVKIPQTIKAYVYTFNNTSKNKIYIDCTTGEVIGGDSMLGGML